MDRENRMREKIEADFSTFRNEINPDLLYESLENLILTIHHNADEAEEQIDSLAGIYRYSLINRQQELVTLEDELNSLENLLHLLNHKYGGAIQFTSHVTTPETIHLIPGSLQVTIDSIVRNTLISKQSPLAIRLYVEDDDDYIVLQHTLNDRLVQHSASLNSFAQLQRSYLFFSEKPFVQVKAGFENYIKFPLVRVQQPTGELL
jgi:LytS/YehU family sensor histidine kinase